MMKYFGNQYINDCYELAKKAQEYASDTVYVSNDANYETTASTDGLRCPSCGIAAPANARFCSGCGERLYRSDPHLDTSAVSVKVPCWTVLHGGKVEVYMDDLPMSK